MPKLWNAKHWHSGAAMTLQELQALRAELSKKPVLEYRRKQRGRPEESLQRSCMTWNLAQRKNFPLLDWMFHPANGGGRSRAEAGALKACGVKSGVPDLLLPVSSGLRYAGLAIELKSPAGRLRKEQKDWLLRFYVGGYLVGVVRNLWEYEALVREFHGASKADCLWPGAKELGLKETRLPAGRGFGHYPLVPDHTLCTA